jgi:acyl carrier protein
MFGCLSTPTLLFRHSVAHSSVPKQRNKLSLGICTRHRKEPFATYRERYKVYENVHRGPKMTDAKQDISNSAKTTIERRRLPLLGPYVEPRSPTEQKLAEIWRSLFSMDSVGITDRYEDLGGDSLMAAGIFVEIELKLGVNLPWSVLAEADTIEKMALRIDELQRQTK